ncbi:hypothetical protein BRD09_08435 [Halobacteriales archaeon SW_10_68_16]|jgi:hypothetical protein|nr:MAG: hypothetical protein BRD09_08435 [Halobacteriales archaeon SW_10_68_16]
MDIETDFSGPAVIALVGAVLAGVGAVVPWVTAAIDIGPVGSTVVVGGLDAAGPLTLVLAAIAALVVLTPGFGRDGPVATGIVGVAIVVVGSRGFLAVPGFAAPGVGLYLTIGGGIVLAIGGLLDYVARADPGSSTPG